MADSDGGEMGRPVIHFEVTGSDGAKLQRYYSELFGWEIDANNPLDYGLIDRKGNTDAQGVGIGGGVGAAPAGGSGHVTFYVEVPDVEAALARAETLGGTRLFGPAEIPGTQALLGQFADPEGHVLGVMTSS
jgi:predicted enzyme related to lactoylglutathione lyase